MNVPSQDNDSKQIFQFRLRLLLTSVAFCAALMSGIQPLILAAWVAVILFAIWMKAWWSAAAMIAGLVFISATGMATTHQVRLDTGDQRTLLWGIPIEYRPTETELRQALLQLDGARHRREWVTVGERHLSMLRVWYESAGAWAREDQTVAELLMLDLADYEKRDASQQSVEWITVLSMTDFEDEETGGSIFENWESAPEVKSYIAEATHRRRVGAIRSIE